MLKYAENIVLNPLINQTPNDPVILFDFPSISVLDLDDTKVY